jgi:hypothetical protein
MKEEAMNQMSGNCTTQKIFEIVCEDNIMKPTKYCLKKGGQRGWEYNGEVNLFKVHYMLV